MNTKALKENILKLNLAKWKIMQTNLNSLVLFKTEYKYTECVYLQINNSEVNLRYEKVFDISI